MIFFIRNIHFATGGIYTTCSLPQTKAPWASYERTEGTTALYNKNNRDCVYFNGFSVLAQVLDMVTLMLQALVGGG